MWHCNIEVCHRIQYQGLQLAAALRIHEYHVHAPTCRAQRLLQLQMPLLSARANVAAMTPARSATDGICGLQQAQDTACGSMLTHRVALAASPRLMHFCSALMGTAAPPRQRGPPSPAAAAAEWSTCEVCWPAVCLGCGTCCCRASLKLLGSSGLSQSTGVPKPGGRFVASCRRSLVEPVGMSAALPLLLLPPPPLLGAAACCLGMVALIAAVHAACRPSF